MFIVAIQYYETGKGKMTGDTYVPIIPRSYSVDEIIAAGGPTLFANKLGKKPKLIENKLSLLSSDSFLTDQEINDALTILNGSK